MKKVKFIGYWFVLFVLLADAGCKEKKSDKPALDIGVPTVYKNAKGETVEKVAVITTKFGSMVIRFFPDIAPKHVENFIKLTDQGFYNGTIFHRVIPGFMIQGGDPNSKDHKNRMTHGTGGPGYTVPAEFSSKSHLRGIVSMARSADPNSAGSQFFICVADAPHLNGQYTVFGEVIEGMDVADKIVSAPRDPRDNPIETIEVEIKMQEQPK